MSYAGQVETSGGTLSPVASTLYGVCNTAAATAAKVVTLPDYDELVVGTTVHVKFTYGNSAANPTLAVGSTAAKNIYAYDTTPPGTTEATSWKINSMVSLTYDGYYWRINGAGTDRALAAYTDSKVAAEATARESSIVKKIAPAYSAASTYASGALCIYNETLYRCNTAITEAEAWNSAHWTAINYAYGCQPRVGEISMPAASWTGGGPWAQTVTVVGTPVYAKSMVSLQPDATVYGRMATDGTSAIYISNNNGTLTATAVTKRPTADLVNVQCTVVETA